MYISARLLSIFFLSLLIDIALFKINELLSKLLRVNRVTFSSITDNGNQIKNFINFFSAILATSSNIFSYTIYKEIKHDIVKSVLGTSTFQIISAITIVFDIGYIIYVIYNMLHYRIIKLYKIDKKNIDSLKEKTSKGYITKEALERMYNMKSSKVIWIVHRLVKEGLLEYNKNAISRNKYKII